MSATADRLAFLAGKARSIRRTVIGMCRERGGYAGQGIALAELAACVYFDEMRTAPDGSFADRFVLSNGHDAIAIYAALAELGTYGREELLTYGADGSRIEMSPIEGSPGFEITAGSLGQGPSQAAGIAYGERLRGRDVRIYCLLSDGELQEGNVWEAAMFAGHHQLDNLVLLIDNNNLQADGFTATILGVEPVPEKFQAFGFAARRVDGNSISEVLDAFAEARVTKGKPFAMVCDTKLFQGVPSLQKKYPLAHYFVTDQKEWDAALAELEQMPDLY